jgi:NADH-quinone oxidoreductase subunit I
MSEYFKDLWLGGSTTVQSMWITIQHFFRPNNGCTLQYPTVKATLPQRARMRLFNKIEDCIGCGQCARVCPTDCIDIQTEKRGKDEPAIFASDGTAIKLRTFVFGIDMTLLLFGLCTFHARRTAWSNDAGVRVRSL